MNQKEFDSLVSTAANHIFVFSSRLIFPLNIGVHTRVVTVKDGVPTRWEIHRRKYKDCKIREGHLHINYMKPREGWYRYRWKTEKKFDSKLLFHIGGGDDIKKIIENIETNIKQYPFKNRYFALGINSNTFTQYILDHNHKLNIKLPYNAIGILDYSKILKN